MLIDVTCRRCRQQYFVAEAFAGQAIACHTCSTPVEVPDSAPLELAEPDILGDSLGSEALFGEAASATSSASLGPAPMSRKKRRYGNQGTKVVGYAIGSVAAVAVLAVAVVLIKQAVEGISFGGAGRFPIASIAVPAIPELGPTRGLPSGVTAHEVNWNAGSGPGASMRMRVLLPPGEHADGSLSCVLVAPAGTNLLMGSHLDPSDYHDETLPYANAGIAVVHYSIDGAGSDPARASHAMLSKMYKSFRAAHAGVVNGRNALEFVLAKLPQVDPDRIYSAGHSSAGTLALLLAEHEPRLAGCIAYAAVADVKDRLGPVIYETGVETVFPGIKNFVRQSSPRTHAKYLQGPTFIFHARDDNNVTFGEGKDFVNHLKSLGNDVTFVTANRGGHYQSMVDEGVPAAIQWLHSKAGSVSRPSSSPARLADSSPPNETSSNGVGGAAGQPSSATFDSAAGTNASPAGQRWSDVGELPPLGHPVVVLRLKRYSGHENPLSEARGVLRTVRWVRLSYVRLEFSENRIIIGCRGTGLSTGEAQDALRKVGFETQGAAFYPQGLPDGTK